MSSDNNVSSKRKRDDTDQDTAVVAKHLAQTNGTILWAAKVQIYDQGCVWQAWKKRRLMWQIVRVDLVWHQQDMKYQA
ncbi:hypothetical protein SMMN14_09590 [Sphaerulina musiva]